MPPEHNPAEVSLQLLAKSHRCNLASHIVQVTTVEHVQKDGMDPSDPTTQVPQVVHQWYKPPKSPPHCRPLQKSLDRESQTRTLFLSGCCSLLQSPAKVRAGRAESAMDCGAGRGGSSLQCQVEFPGSAFERVGPSRAPPGANRADRTGRGTAARNSVRAECQAPLHQETVPPTVLLTSEAEKAWCVCVCVCVCACVLCVCVCKCIYV